MKIKDFENKIICGDWIKILKTLPDNIYHACICSPPYWGQRDYGCEGQMGLEKTPEEHIKKLVEGFREVRRVLRPDGVLWVNYGDKYSGGGNNRGNNSPISAKQASNKGATGQVADLYKVEGLTNGNLLMLPARVALALQADGWILRDDVIWAKAISFCSKYSGSTMPESVNGWRWERHRIKVEKGNRGKETQRIGSIPHRPQQDHNGKDFKPSAKYIECPGCPMCEPNGGLVLRRGSWRCTKAHEHIFQFTKSNDYFCDMEAVKEEQSQSESAISRYKYKPSKESGRTDGISRPSNSGMNDYYMGTGRNLRNVWAINPRGYKKAHYATYPESLIEPCIKVSTSQKGVCPKCGAPWARIVENKAIKRCRPNDRTDRHSQGDGVNSCGNTVAGVKTTTIGWKATCDCGIEETVPAMVLDPFIGSGTTAVVAAKLNRNYTGIEINSDYIDNHITGRVKAVETGVPEAEVGQGALFD